MCGVHRSTRPKCRFRCDLRPAANWWPEVHLPVTDHRNDHAKRPRASPKWRLWDGKRGRNAGTGLAAGPTTILAKGRALLWDAGKNGPYQGDLAMLKLSEGRRDQVNRGSRTTEDLLSSSHPRFTAQRPVQTRQYPCWSVGPRRVDRHSSDVAERRSFGSASENGAFAEVLDGFRRPHPASAAVCACTPLTL